VTVALGVARRVERIMGTAIGIDVRSAVPATALDDAFAYLRDVDARFSPFMPDSEISRLARGELAMADAGDDLGGDPRGIDAPNVCRALIGEAVDGQDREETCPEGDEHVGPHAGRVIVDLALGPDRGPEGGGHQQPEREVQLKADVDHRRLEEAITEIIPSRPRGST